MSRINKLMPFAGARSLRTSMRVCKSRKCRGRACLPAVPHDGNTGDPSIRLIASNELRASFVSPRVFQILGKFCHKRKKNKRLHTISKC